MIRAWRALVWLRAKTLANTLRGRRQRDALERSSRVLALLVSLLGTLIVLAAAIGLGALGWFAGRAVASGGIEPAPLVLFFRLGLLLLLAILVLAPLGRSAMGPQSGSSRLALLPLSRRALHLAQLSAGLLDPWIAPAIPLFLLLPMGLAVEGEAVPAALAFFAGLLVLWTLAAAGSLASLGMQAFLRRRGRAEVAALLFFGLVSLGGMLPALMQGKIERRAVRHAKASPEEIERRVPAAVRVLPTESYGGALRAALDGRPARSLAFSGALLAWAVGLTFASARLHSYLLDAPEEGRARRRSSSRTAEGTAWPGLSSQASAVARVQMRTVVRTLRGKFGLFFTGPLVALIAVVLRRVHGGGFFDSFLSRHGYLMLSGATFMAISTTQPLLANLFAVDKAGLTRQLLAPVSDRDLLAGKLAGAGVLYCGSLLLCFAGIALVLPGGSPLLWLSGLVGGVSVYLLLAPLLALLSMAFPKASDLNKLGHPGNPHGAAALVATLAAALACAPPALFLGVGSEILGLPWLTLGATLLWALLAGLLVRLCLGPLSRALGERRENLGLVADVRC